jgi:acetyl-CoA synthetase
MTDHKPTEYDDLLREDRTFTPPPEFRARAHVKDASLYEEAERDFEGYWARLAGELDWVRTCSIGGRRTRSGSSAAS